MLETKTPWIGIRDRHNRYCPSIEEIYARAAELRAMRTGDPKGFSHTLSNGKKVEAAALAAIAVTLAKKRSK